MLKARETHEEEVAAAQYVAPEPTPYEASLSSEAEQDDVAAKLIEFAEDDDEETAETATA